MLVIFLNLLDNTEYPMCERWMSNEEKVKLPCCIDCQRYQFTGSTGFNKAKLSFLQITERPV